MSRKIFERNKIRWVHIVQPQEEDFSYIKSLFNFHPLVIESLVAPTLHPLIENYQNHIFLILHFPLIHRNHEANIALEVDFLMTRDLIITVTYRSCSRLDDFFERLSADASLQERVTREHSGLLVYQIIDWLFGPLLHDIDFIEEQVTTIENKIFEQKVPLLIEEISQARRDILDFKRIIAPLQTVLGLLPAMASAFWDKSLRPYFVDLLTSESKIRHLIENHQETIEALHETHTSLVTSRISKIIALLTIFSTIILPLNFVASIWGMNHRFLPLRDGPYDFWLLLGIMAFIALSLTLFFRRRGWL